MNHDEALRAAMKPHWFPTEEHVPGKMIEELVQEATDVIRAYIEARGLALVPKVATEEMLDASWALTGESSHMRSRVHSRMNRHYNAMLAAAPDPFGDAP